MCIFRFNFFKFNILVCCLVIYLLFLAFFFIHPRCKLSVFNFTIFNTGCEEGHSYVLTEDIGRKGSNNFASFVFDSIGKMSKRNVKKFIFYSDNCAGQNRNRFVYSMYALAARIYNVEITHRFLEKGHTQNESDSMHA